MKIKVLSLLVIFFMIFGCFTATGLISNKNLKDSEIDNSAPTYRAVIVGIAEYKMANNLRYCDDDAKDIKNVLISQGWNSNNINILLNNQATKAGIVNALENLKDKEKSGDVSLFTFSGHGTRGILREALCPYDTSLIGNYIYDTELASILDGFEGKIVCVLDSCYAGGMDAQGDLTEKGDDYMDQYVNEFTSTFIGTLGASKSNRVILMACAKNEYSYEFTELRNGLFSHFIVKGLSGNADGCYAQNRDEEITAEETFLYAKQKTIDYIRQYSASQVPQIFDGDSSKEVTLVTYEDDPDPIDPIPLDFSFVLHRIKFLDEIEGLLHIPGAEISYKLSVYDGEDWQEIVNNEYTTNADDSNPGDSPSLDIKYDFEITTRYPEIKLKVWERDTIDANDQADISSEPGWGLDDTDDDVEGTIFYCKYDVVDHEIEQESNIVESQGKYFYTSGELDKNANSEPDDGNDAKVWFQLVEDYEAPVANLKVTGSIDKTVNKDNEVNFKDVGGFEIENDAVDPPGSPRRARPDRHG